MEGPVTIGTIIGSILSMATRVGETVRDLLTVPDYIQQIQNEAEAFRSMVILLRRLLLENELQKSDAMKKVNVHNLATQLGSFMRTFVLLEKALDGVQEDNMGIADRAEWKWRDDELKILLLGLESHKATLTLTLVTMQSYQMQQIHKTMLNTMSGSTQTLLPSIAMPSTSASPSLNLPSPIPENKDKSIENNYVTIGTEPDAFQVELGSALPYETVASDITWSELHASGQSIFSYKPGSRRRGYLPIERMEVAGPSTAFSKEKPLKSLNKALLSAAFKCDVNEMSRLVAMGADVNYLAIRKIKPKSEYFFFSSLKSGYRYIATPLLLVFRSQQLLYSRLASQRFLLDHGANLNANLFEGTSYLHLAAFHGVFEDFLGPKLNIIKRFLDYGADIDARDENGWTPLMYSARWGKKSFIRATQILLSHGGDPAIKDNNGDSCESIILKERRLKIVLKPDGDKNCPDDWLLVRYP